jgi:hypothetical protein
MVSAPTNALDAAGRRNAERARERVSRSASLDDIELVQTIDIQLRFAPLSTADGGSYGSMPA